MPIEHEENQSNHIGIQRSRFIIKKKGEFGFYTLFSEKYGRIVTMTLEFYDIEAPSEDDVLLMPDSMLCEDYGCPIFSNRRLCFGKPNEKLAVPKDFNIEKDCAYVYYSTQGKNAHIQRYYG